MTYARRMSGFGELIRRVREERGWTQQELADRTGVSRKTVTRWEAGENVPDVEQVKAATSALGLPTEQAFRALGWLPNSDDGGSRRDELLRIVGDMTDAEREQFLIEILELEARRRRNSQ